MFFSKTTSKNQGSVSFETEPVLIDKQYKHRTLGEMVALARATGQKPLPTRNGVYTGEYSVPRETTDKLNLQRELMDSYDEAENKLKDANKQMQDSAKEREFADMKAKIIADYEAEKQSGNQ